jgi:hypothetical protein
MVNTVFIHSIACGGSKGKQDLTRTRIVPVRPSEPIAES